MAIFSVSSGVSSDVKFNVPTDLCCNCGSAAGLTPVATRLKKTRYMVLAGTEITVTFNFPYCPDCVKTAKRSPVGIASKLLMAVLLFVVALTVWSFSSPSITQAVPMGMVLPALTVLSLGVVFGIYSLRKPKGRQTSYYQPIRLKKIRQKFTGGITGYVLAFTNNAYEQKFVSVNQEAIAKNMIEVRPI
jgi:hypothetical protein